MKNFKREKSLIRENKIHYIKRLIQEGKDANGYSKNIIIMNLTLQNPDYWFDLFAIIIYHLRNLIIILSLHISHHELFGSN